MKTASAIQDAVKNLFFGNLIFRFVENNRRALGAAVIFCVVALVVYTANPTVWSKVETIRSVVVTFPLVVFLVIPLTFMVTGGDIDLSFPAVMGMTAWVFALATKAGWNPLIGFVLAIVTGLVLGLMVGTLVVYGGLSPLITTIGANFFLRGLINLGAVGYSIPLPVAVRETLFYNLYSGTKFAGFPIQSIWAFVFVIVGWFLYNRHSFGVHVHCIGDNPVSSTEMGINVQRTRVAVYIFVGFGAALAGVLSVVISMVWWPTTGDGFLLIALASIFVGGTPAWAGVGTVVGAAFGAAIVRLLEPGIIAAGLRGFYTQLVYGLTIILSLLGHRFNGERHR